MKNIQENNAIWDLHIHTCDCPKASNEFGEIDDRTTFISKIIEIFNKHKDLELFSFTDHNQISIDVYQEYINQGGKLNFIVGVEQDVYLDHEEKTEPKHLIIYFNIEKQNFGEYKTFMNEYNNFVKKRVQNISKILGFLVGKHIRFVLSPHAFKQDKRAINYEWSYEEITESEAPKYTDQLFCFWEASGQKSISNAEQFLKDFDMEEKISIIAFSDSNNFKTLEEYLDRPNQYFAALPSFRGLELVATENRRILRKQSDRPSGDFGNLIGNVNFNGEDINFSSRLNCIIGGRGSGKSLLLDSIANHLSKTDINQKRRDYIDQFPITVYNFSNRVIEKNNFSFDYFRQSYVTDLFNSDDYYNKIKDQFKDELSQIDDIDVDAIKSENKNAFLENIKDFPVSDGLENISDFINKYKILTDKTFRNSLLVKDKGKRKVISYKKYSKFNEKVMKLIPDEINGDIEIIEAVQSLYNVILKRMHEYNKDVINSDIIKNFMIDQYQEYKRGVSTDSKNKIIIEDLIKKTFVNRGYLHSKRVNIINAYIKAEKDFRNLYEEEIIVDGEKPNAFKIKKVLKIETPYEYLSRILKDNLFAKDYKGVKADFDLEMAIENYCFTRDLSLKNNKKLSELDEELLEFDLKYDDHPQILYLTKHDYEDIVNLSPGTQTNILLEYFVYKDTGRPLLIDQPEDNVDNQTIYTQLRKWFAELKNKRQVIVVTHDANIVINADAENIIIASHTEKNKFEYSTGALEYKDNLDIASNILDGGKEAVKKRLMKYGE